MSEQKPVSRRLRFEILRRDNYTCRYCGASAPDATLTVDHVIPSALGGGDDPTNLVTACQDCNAGKASTSPDEGIVADVDAAALLFAKAIEKVGDTRRAERDVVDAMISRFNAAWCEWTWEYNGEKREIPRQQDWPLSLERFIAAGLNEDDLNYYLDVAMHSRATISNAWKYFCGCCWREITTRQEAARALIEDGGV